MGGEILAVTGSQSPALLSSARRSVLDRATAPQSSALRNPDTRWGSHGDLRPLMGDEVVTPEEPPPSHSAYDKGVVPTRRAAQPMRWLQALGLASDAEAVNDLGPATVALDRNGLVRLHWANGMKITESAAREAVAAVNHICAGQRHPMLVDMTGTASVTRPARAGRGNHHRVVGYVSGGPGHRQLHPGRQHNAGSDAVFRRRGRGVGLAAGRPA